MFERFTDASRRVIVLAQEEARLLKRDHIGTEHLLVGLVREGEGVAARAFSKLGISLASMREAVEETIGRGDHSSTGNIPFTSNAQRALELARREALRLGANYIGTEHILLGLISLYEDNASELMVKCGAQPSAVLEQVMHQLNGLDAEQDGIATPEALEGAPNNGWSSVRFASIVDENGNPAEIVGLSVRYCDADGTIKSREYAARREG